MRLERTEVTARRKEPLPSGRTDAELFVRFTNGQIPRGSKLEVTSQTIPLRDGKGAEVILFQSVAYLYSGTTPDIEHLVFSKDERVTSMRLRRLTHWQVTGKISEEELEKTGAEMAQDKHGF